MSLSSDLAAIAGNTVILHGRSNYEKWAWSIEGTAKLGLFWSAYDGTNVPIDTTADKKEACLHRERKALGLLKKTVDPIIALEIQSMSDIKVTTIDPTSEVVTITTRRPTAKDVWDHLKGLYQKADAVTTLLEYRLLHRTVLNDDGNLEAQLNHLTQLRSRCALNGFGLKDYEFAATILISLPDSYSHIADFFLATTEIEDLKVEEVHEKILETEICRKSNADPTTNVIHEVGQPSILKKPKGACFKCGQQDLGQDLKVWNGNKGKRPSGGNQTINIIEESPSEEECDTTAFFYDSISQPKVGSWILVQLTA